MEHLNKSATAKIEKENLTELLKSADSLKYGGIGGITITPDQFELEEQKKWIFGLLSMMEHAISTMGNIDENDPIVKNKYQPFKDYLLKTYLWKREATEEDLQKGNGVLDAVIEYCKQKLKQYNTS